MGMDDENTGRRRSRRRSSILKLPLSTIDVNKQVEEKPETKSRRSSKRVSFANYAEVKEFHEVSLSYNSNSDDSGNKQTSDNWNKEPNKISDIQSLLTGEIKNTTHAVENISDGESDEEMCNAVNPLNQSIIVSSENVSPTTYRSSTISQTMEDKENINVCTIDPEVRNSLPQATHVNNSDKQAQDTSFLESCMVDIPLSSTTNSSQKSLLFTNNFNCPASLSTELFLYNYVNTHTKDDDQIQAPDESEKSNSLLDSPHLDKSLYQGNHTIYFDRNDSMDFTKPLGKYLTACNESKDDDVLSSPDDHKDGYYNQNNSYNEKTIYFNRTHHAASNMDLTCCNTITVTNFLENERLVEITKGKDAENTENFCENKQFNKDESLCKPAKDLTNPLKPTDNYMPPSSNKSIGQLSNHTSKNIIDKENIPCELNRMQSDNFRANNNPKDDLGSVTDFRSSVTDISNTRTEGTILKDQMEHIKIGSKRTCFSETSEIPSKQSNTHDISEPAIKKQNISVCNALVGQPKGQNLEFASKLSGLIHPGKNELNVSELVEKKSEFRDHAQSVTTNETVPEKLVLTTVSHMVESSSSCPKKTLVDPSQLASKQLNITKSTKTFLNTQDLLGATKFDNNKFNKLSKEPTVNTSKSPADDCIPSSFNEPSNLPFKNIIEKENILPLSQKSKLTDLSDKISSQNKTNIIKAAEPLIKNESQMITSCLIDPLAQPPIHDSVSNKNSKDSDTNFNGTYANDVNILKTKTNEKAVGFPELTENKTVLSEGKNNFGLSNSSENCEEVKHSSGEVINEKEKRNNEIVSEIIDNVTRVPSETKHILYISMNTSGAIQSFNVEKSVNYTSHSEGLHLTEKDSIESKESMPPFSSGFTGKCKENVLNEIMPPSVQVPGCSNIAVDNQNASETETEQTSVSYNKAEKLSGNDIQDNKIQTGKHKLSTTDNHLTKLHNKLFNVGNVIENVKKGEVKKGFSDCVLKINTSDVSSSSFSIHNNLKKSNDSSFNTSNVFSKRQTHSETINSKLIASFTNSNSFTGNKGSLMVESSIQPDQVVTEKCLRTDTSGTQHNDKNSVSEKTGFDFDNADVSDIMDEKSDFLIESISHEDSFNLSPEKIQPSRSAILMTERSISDIKNNISTSNSISESRLCSRLLMNIHFPHMERPLSLMEVETIEDLLFLVGIDRLENVALECRRSNIYGTSMVFEPQSIEEKMELGCILYPKYQSTLKSYEELKSLEERFMEEFKDPELLYGFKNILEEREKTNTNEDIKKQLMADFKICKQRTDKKMKQKKIEYFSDLSSAYTDKLLQMEKANSQIVDITSKLDEQIDNLDKVLKDFDDKIELLNSKSEYSEAQIKCYKESRKYLDEAESIKQEEGVVSMKCIQFAAKKTKLVEAYKTLETTHHQLQNGETPEQLSLENKDIELNLYSILSPWKIWDLEDNVYKFTFWLDTLQLSLYTDSLKNVTEISVVVDEIWESVAEDHPWLCLVHNMRIATLKEEEIFKDCTTVSQFSQLLHIFSTEMMKLQDLAEEIYSLSIKYNLKLKNNCITVTYCCLKSMSKVIVDFYVDAVQYSSSFIKFEIKHQYGQISCEDIARRLRKVQPGLYYFSRLVNAVDLELAASKF